MDMKNKYDSFVEKMESDEPFTNRQLLYIAIGMSVLTAAASFADYKGWINFNNNSAAKTENVITNNPNQETSLNNYMLPKVSDWYSTKK